MTGGHGTGAAFGKLMEEQYAFSGAVTLAMALAASWKPLMYSNTTATTMTITISRKGSIAGDGARA